MREIFLIVPCLMTCLLDIQVPLVLRFFCFPPAGFRRPAARSRAGHDGAARTQSRPVTAGHVQSRLSRRCGLGHGRHGAESPGQRRPGPLPLATPESLAHDTLALCDRSCVRSVRHESSRPLESRCAAPARPRRCPRDFAATPRSRRQTKMSQGHKGPKQGSLAPGSCPGGSQAIGH